MQSLDVISVNIWSILISLANLIILFLIIKKFLFKPVKNIMAKRDAEIEEAYASAEQARRSAAADEKAWQEQMEHAQEEADRVLQDATKNARYREEKMIEAARNEAEGIVRSARQEAALERKKATDEIRREIVEVSGALTEKLLNREINEEDHRAIIASFISEVGEGGPDE
ncbi:MAG: F0F1 ATP synthase subunit B [Ruminococcaceae bacterium]|nr:F0F1 ATP synthase subunit B [Oscillospiraceae bacterium]